MKHLSKFLVSTSLLLLVVPGCGSSSKGGTSNIITYHTYESSTQNNEISGETFIENLKNGIANLGHSFVKVEVSGNDKFDFIHYRYGEEFKESYPFTEKTDLSYVTTVDFGSAFYANLGFLPIDFSTFDPSTRGSFAVAYSEILLPYEFGRAIINNRFVKATYGYFEHKLTYEDYSLGSLFIDEQTTQPVSGHGYLAFSDDYNVSEMKLYIDGTNKEFTYTFSYYGENDIRSVDGEIDATTFAALFSLYANRPHNKNKLDFSASGETMIITGYETEEIVIDGQPIEVDIAVYERLNFECNLYYQIDNPNESNTALSQMVYASFYQDPVCSPEEYQSQIVSLVQSLFGPNQTIFKGAFPTFRIYLNYEITSLRISNGNLIYTVSIFSDVEDDDGNIIEKHHKYREFEYEINQFGLLTKSTRTDFDVETAGDKLSVTGTFLYK